MSASHPGPAVITGGTGKPQRARSSGMREIRGGHGDAAPWFMRQEPPKQELAHLCGTIRIEVAAGPWSLINSDGRNGQ